MNNNYITKIVNILLSNYWITDLPDQLKECIENLFLQPANSRNLTPPE